MAPRFALAVSCLSGLIGCATSSDLDAVSNDLQALEWRLDRLESEQGGQGDELRALANEFEAIKYKTDQFDVRCYGDAIALVPTGHQCSQ